jgi:hypothetical protein
MVVPPLSFEIIFFFFEELLQALHRAGVEAAGPALRLANLLPGLFERTVLEVVALE